MEAYAKIRQSKLNFLLGLTEKFFQTFYCSKPETRLLTEVGFLIPQPPLTSINTLCLLSITKYYEDASN